MSRGRSRDLEAGVKWYKEEKMAGWTRPSGSRGELLSVLLRPQGISGGLSAGAVMLSFYFIFRLLYSAGRTFL